jgi:hypothetical protein
MNDLPDPKALSQLRKALRRLGEVLHQKGHQAGQAWVQGCVDFPLITAIAERKQPVPCDPEASPHFHRGFRLALRRYIEAVQRD